jgi:hypothetical protein
MAVPTLVGECRPLLEVRQSPQSSARPSQRFRQPARSRVVAEWRRRRHTILLFGARCRSLSSPALWQERPIAHRPQSEHDCGNGDRALVSRNETSLSPASPTHTSAGSKPERARPRSRRFESSLPSSALARSGSRRARKARPSSLPGSSSTMMVGHHRLPREGWLAAYSTRGHARPGALLDRPAKWLPRDDSRVDLGRACRGEPIRSPRSAFRPPVAFRLNWDSGAGRLDIRSYPKLSPAMRNSPFLREQATKMGQVPHPLKPHR